MNRQTLGAFIIVLLAAALRCCGAEPVHAQDREVLLTARVCESEVLPSWSNAARAAECIQICVATAERAVLHHRSYLAELRSYSPRATGVERYVGREHIALMHPDRVPAVERMSAELARVRFVVLAVAAWRCLHGQAEAPCPSALEWGAPWCERCRRRMVAAGYVEVEGCGSNTWWRMR